MKKSILTLLLMGSMTSGFGQQNVNFQTACHPEDVKHYDTKTLRERFVFYTRTFITAFTDTLVAIKKKAAA